MLFVETVKLKKNEAVSGGDYVSLTGRFVLYVRLGRIFDCFVDNSIPLTKQVIKKDVW